MAVATDPSAATLKLEALLSDQPHVPLRPNQLREYQEERARLSMLVDGRDAEGNPVPWLGGNRAEAQRRRREIDKTLAAQAPKPLGARASEVYRLATEVIEKDVRPSMLSHAVMRRNPAGAVGEYNRRENHPTTKRTILTVKRALRALDPHSDDPDLCNMERFRSPGVGPGSAATFDVTGTIPGNFAMSNLAKENWPLGEPLVSTPLAEIKAREAREEAAAAPAPRSIKKAKGRGRTWTPEQKEEARQRYRSRVQKETSTPAAE